MIDWEEIKRDIYTVGLPKENNRAYQEVCKAEAEIAALQARVRELESGMSFAEYKERYTPTTEK